jgi:hypothetical protein
MDMTFDEAVAAIDMGILEFDKPNFTAQVKQAIAEDGYFTPWGFSIPSKYPEAEEIRKQFTPERYANIDNWTQQDWIDNWIAFML